MSICGKQAKRTLVATAIVVALTMTSVRSARAQGYLDASGVGEAGLIIIALLALGVKAIIDAARADAQKPAAVSLTPGPAGPTPPAPSSAPSDGVDSQSSQRAFLSLPRCDFVGGYEDYRARTGNVCRLY